MRAQIASSRSNEWSRGSSWNIWRCFVLSFRKIRGQPMGRQICLTIPFNFKLRLDPPPTGTIKWKVSLLKLEFSTPKVVPFTVDLHENLVKMPLPIRMTARLVTSSSRNLWCKHWPETVPPKPDRFMAYIYTPFMKKVLHITERKRKSNIQHDCKSDDFRAGFEVAKWGTFCHSRKLQISPTRFKQVLADRTTVCAHKLTSLNVI